MFNNEEFKNEAVKTNSPNYGIGRKEYRKKFGGKSTGHRSKAPRHIASRKIKRK